MSILNRANEQQQTIWRPSPEGLWRWIVGVPELKPPDKFPNYQVRFPLSLTAPERTRADAELGPLPVRDASGRDTQQSYRVTYTTGLSLGYFKQGVFQTTRLIDFLAATLGHTNSKKFREFIASGGGPPRPADRDDDKAELDAIAHWLTWWENLEVYGTISHGTDATDPSRVYARFAGPIAVGALPGQKDDDYQALGRGKLRLIVLQNHPELAAREAALQPAPVQQQAPVAVVERPPVQQFTAEGAEVASDGSDELPW